jgi:hypothetical protein
MATELWLSVCLVYLGQIVPCYQENEIFCLLFQACAAYSDVCNGVRRRLAAGSEKTRIEVVGRLDEEHPGLAGRLVDE